MPYEITEGYVPGCIGRVVSLHAAYYSREVGFGLPFEARVAGEMAAFLQRLRTGRDGLWLARDEAGEIHGSIAIDAMHADGEGAHLRWFICSDATRGSGLGRQLLARAIAHCDALGFARIHLHTFAGLDAARHLYESHGFRLIQEQAGEQWGRVVNEQRFERDAAMRGHSH
ncbi:GNAT family N-acetyltransferase [Paucibacter sp. R3-3]|uniref:GNAT family N-acetyltransferase n=1 Tax=Roseateles agri TaxID=3098619 RepID=A0ABU5DT46_9BURK|nr:GNAT family N-acetyltransferase [Paucibacter sp. R3-3]MDY0748332.1 GNAT family N-acetyltransferase [Paucibacter sp. R3-3]